MSIQLCIGKEKAMFTWTEKKNRANKKKHGFFLSDIADVFDDPYLLEFYDAAHSSLDEDRYINIGRFHDAVILFVVTMDKADGNTQIITAREATPREQEAYNDHYKKSTDSGGN
jgi:uncharacterized DUF497 family protein